MSKRYTPGPTDVRWISKWNAHSPLSPWPCRLACLTDLLWATIPVRRAVSLRQPPSTIRPDVHCGCCSEDSGIPRMAECRALGGGNRIDGFRIRGSHRHGGEPPSAGYGCLPNGWSKPQRRSALCRRIAARTPSSVHLPSFRRTGVRSAYCPAAELGPGDVGGHQPHRAVRAGCPVASGGSLGDRPLSAHPVVPGTDGSCVSHGTGPTHLRIWSGQHRVGCGVAGRPHRPLACGQANSSPAAC